MPLTPSQHDRTPGIKAFNRSDFPDWLATPATTLPGLAQSLNSSARARRHLIGYSMGGRLALHQLVAEPTRWEKAVIISAHPGLPASERAARLEADRRWAERFRQESWEKLLGDWNSQSVFGGAPAPARPESDFSRELLARALEWGSLGAQADLRPALRELNLPVLWIAGARDTKYAALARECAALNPRFQHVIIPDAAHRVPWECPAAFLETVERFLDS